MHTWLTHFLYFCLGKTYQSTTCLYSKGTPQPTPCNLTSSKIKNSGESSIRQTKLSNRNKNLNIIKSLTSLYIFKSKILLPFK